MTDRDGLERVAVKEALAEADAVERVQDGGLPVGEWLPEGGEAD